MKVRLLDRGWNVEVEVEYSQCRDLPRQATLLPPRFVQVSLVGVEKLEDWREEHMEHMKCVLHMEDGENSKREVKVCKVYFK